MSQQVARAEASRAEAGPRPVAAAGASPLSHPSRSPLGSSATSGHRRRQQTAAGQAAQRSGRVWRQEQTPRARRAAWQCCRTTAATRAATRTAMQQQMMPQRRQGNMYSNQAGGRQPRCYASLMVPVLVSKVFNISTYVWALCRCAELTGCIRNSCSFFLRSLVRCQLQCQQYCHDPPADRASVTA